MNDWIKFCDKIKEQKEKWAMYEQCFDLMEATKGSLESIWINAPKNSKNAPWDTFLPSFWYGLGVSNDLEIISNEHYKECLKSILDVKDGAVNEDRYKVFSRIYGALFPTSPNITTGLLFLKSIVELHQQRYFVGVMDSQSATKILAANSDDSFLLRISISSGGSFCVSRKSGTRELSIEREHYFKGGIVQYIKLKIMVQNLKPITNSRPPIYVPGEFL